MKVCHIVAIRFSGIERQLDLHQLSLSLSLSLFFCTYWPYHYPDHSRQLPGSLDRRWQLMLGCRVPLRLAALPAWSTGMFRDRLVEFSTYILIIFRTRVCKLGLRICVLFASSFFNFNVKGLVDSWHFHLRASATWTEHFAG